MLTPSERVRAAGYPVHSQRNKTLQSRMRLDKETGCRSRANEQLVTGHQEHLTPANLSNLPALSRYFKKKEGEGGLGMMDALLHANIA